MNRFYTSKENAAQIAKYLFEKLNYEENDPCSDDKDSIYIDTEKREFYFIDTTTLQHGREIVKHKFEEEIHSTTLNDIQKWEQ